MIFHLGVPEIDRKRIRQALRDIRKHGDRFQKDLAKLIENTELKIFLGPADEVGGSGSIDIGDLYGARRAVGKRGLSEVEAARFVRLNIARETIDTGGQRGIEGTFVHEGKHALDFALMLSSFSHGEGATIFNPTAFQREYSAHLTSALYLLRRGGEYTDEGLSLGILERKNGRVRVSGKGIHARLERNYGLTEQEPGPRLNHGYRLKPRRKKFLGLL